MRTNGDERGGRRCVPAGRWRGVREAVREAVRGVARRAAWWAVPWAVPRTGRLAVAVPLLALGGCGLLPTRGDDISQGELLLELSDTINELRAQDALLQEELDVLRATVARQDSTIVRLANAAGVPLPPP